MTMIDKCVCCIIAAIVILMVGCVNPECFQARDEKGSPKGYPSYIWLAVISAIAGCISCSVYK